MEIYIVLGVMVFMIVGFMLNKWPFGLTTMICCAVLALTGVFNTQQAFSGFSSRNVVLLAPMFAMSMAFGKTSLLKKIQDEMVRLKGKNGFILLVGLYLVVIIFAQFLPTTANMTIMLMFLLALGDTGDITPSRVTIPILAMISVWGTKLPLGVGATSHITLNAFYEGLITEEGHLLQILDTFKVSIIPCLILTAYSLFAYKLMPNTQFDSNQLKTKKKDDGPQLDKTHETIIYVVFVLVMISLFFGNVLGDKMYVIPAIGIIALILTKAVSVKEAVGAMTQDAVWMIAGVLVMADALGATGAGDLIGNGILAILGGDPSGLFVMFVFAVTTVVMTTFMSNTATRNVLVPIAATTCAAAGWDPRGVILIVAFCANVAIAFPSGSPACGIAYAAGGYKLSSTFKFTLPFIALAIVSIVLSCYVFFPI